MNVFLTVNLQHIRSTAFWNMVIKCSIVVALFIISLWWLPAAYISGVLLCLFILLEFHDKSIYHILFFFPFENMMLIFFYVAVALFVASSIIRFCITQKGEWKKYSVLIASSTLLLLYCLAFTIPMFGMYLPLLLGGVLLAFVCVISKVKFKPALYWFIAGLVASCLIGIMVLFAPGLLLYGDVPYVFGRKIEEHHAFGMLRFAALTINTNRLHMMASIAIASLMVLDLQRRTKIWEFISLVVLMSAIAFSTIARTFLISFTIMLLAYFILKIMKEKKHAFTTLAVLGVALLTISGVMFPVTVANISRLRQEPILIPYDPPPSQGPIFVEPGEIDDPGRFGIWRRNLRDWTSSPFTFLFGRGIDSPHIGNMHQHNAIVFFLVKTGIIGLALFIAFLASLMFTLYKVKKYKFNINAMLILLAAFCISMTELMFRNYLFFMFIAFFIFAVADDEEEACNS